MDCFAVQFVNVNIKLKTGNRVLKLVEQCHLCIALLFILKDSD